MKRRTLGMTTICKVLLAGAFLAGASLVGCEHAAYSEDEVVVPMENQTQQAAQPPSGNGLSSVSQGLEGRNSTLGKAKGAAQGIINNAEQASQNTANEADKLMNPDR